MYRTKEDEERKIERKRRRDEERETERKLQEELKKTRAIGACVCMRACA